jgi:hypothetical protein
MRDYRFRIDGGTTVAGDAKGYGIVITDDRSGDKVVILREDLDRLIHAVVRYKHLTSEK